MALEEKRAACAACSRERPVRDLVVLVRRTGTYTATADACRDNTACMLTVSHRLGQRRWVMRSTGPESAHEKA